MIRGTPPRAAPRVLEFGHYWLRVSRAAWVGAACWDWDRAETEWVLADVITGESYLTFGDDTTERWVSEHSVVVVVGPRVAEPGSDGA